VNKIPIEELPDSWPPEARELYQQFAEKLHQKIRYARDYLKALNRFLQFQHQQGFPFRELPLSLLDQHMKPCNPGKRLLLTALRAWLRFLYRQRELMLPLHESLPYYRFPPKKRRVLLSHEQVRQVLALPPVTEPLGLRDRAFLEVAYGTGMRRGELNALDLADLDLSQGLVVVRKPKNLEQRTVPLTNWALHWLLRYLEEGRPKLLSPLSLNALWLTDRGRRMRLGGIGERFQNDYRAPKVLDFPFTLHQLRHACATHLLQAGASIRDIQQLLGHRELASTKIYTHLTPTRLREQHRRCHPRFRPPFRQVF